MKQIILFVGFSLFSLNALAAANSVCEEKAKTLVKAVHLADWPADQKEIVDVTVSEIGKQKGETHTYAVMVDTGKKMDMAYVISLDESGPSACYLRSIRVPSN